VIGPLCRDTNIVAGQAHIRCGGVTYYAGAALARLEVETTVLGACRGGNPPWPDIQGARLTRLPAAGTLEFVNEYPQADLSARTQRATAHDNRIGPSELEGQLPSGLDFVVLGPLFHDNFEPETVAWLALKYKVALAAQGLIRHLERDKVVWRNPGRVIGFLPHCEWVALDEAELAFISGEADLESGARRLIASGAGNVLVTRAERGSVLVLREGIFHIPAFPPALSADPTGAGDTYLAAFLRAAGLFDSPRQQGEFAALAATLCIEREGAFDSSLEGVLERLKAFKPQLDE